VDGSRITWPPRRYSLADAARICGVDERLVREFAEWYRTMTPAVITVGNGLERNRNGGSGIRAVFALPALAGKFGVPGGGLINGAGFAFPKTPARLARPDFVPDGTRLINIIDVGRHLNDPTMSPPIRRSSSTTTIRSSCIPRQNRLRRGLEREDLFVVGSDVVMTTASPTRTSCCRPAATSSTRTSSRRTARTAPARRSGDPAAGRGPCQHRDLPAPRGRVSDSTTRPRARRKISVLARASPCGGITGSARWSQCVPYAAKRFRVLEVAAGRQHDVRVGEAVGHHHVRADHEQILALEAAPQAFCSDARRTGLLVR